MITKVKTFFSDDKANAFLKSISNNNDFRYVDTQFAVACHPANNGNLASTNIVKLIGIVYEERG